MANLIILVLSLLTLRKFPLALPSMLKTTHMIPGVISSHTTSQRTRATPSTLPHDQMQYWYHTSPVAGGSTCGVIGNDPADGQTEVSPNDIVEDGVFFSALLTADATVTVQIGSGPVYSYAGTAGHNHWSLPFNGQTGVPVFSVVRDGVTVKSSSNAAPITASTTLSNGCTNYNAWVGSWQAYGTSGESSSSSVPVRLLRPPPRRRRPRPPRPPAKPVSPAPALETTVVCVPSAVTTATVLARMEPPDPARAPRTGRQSQRPPRQGRMAFRCQVRMHLHGLVQFCVQLWILSLNGLRGGLSGPATRHVSRDLWHQAQTQAIVVFLYEGPRSVAGGEVGKLNSTTILKRLRLYRESLCFLLSLLSRT